MKEVAGIGIAGFSLGGIETQVSVPAWSLAIDVGRGRDALARMNHLALTHTHMDHAGGLAYIIALRQLYGMAQPTVYVPQQMADPLRDMLDLWRPLQRYEMRYTLVPVTPGVDVPLRKGLSLRPFRTYHPVPSVGYSVIETVKKLKTALHGTLGQTLAEMKRAGEVITDTIERRLLSVTGDTLPQVLDREPALSESQVLILECTFLDAQKQMEHVKAGGHIHLDDLMARADCLTMPHLVLSHFSQIHRPHEIAELLRPLAARIPGKLYAFPTSPDAPWIEVEP